MKYWLIKTEPNGWSWKDQINSKNQVAEWNGVRNYQARNNLKKMKINNLCFFYHTGDEKKIIGIVLVVKEFFNDKTDKSKKFVSILIKAKKKLIFPVSLKSLKKISFFRDFPLIKQSRLSVMDVKIKYWKKICKMGRIA